MYQESLDMWAGEKWTDCVRNKGLHRANEDNKILQTIKRRKADWFDYMWRRNCLLKHFILGNI
jgi:hypothetical protein